MKICSKAALLGFITGSSLLLARAAEEKKEPLPTKDPLPTAQAVLERYSREIGGKTAFAAHKSQHVTGTMEIPAQKISGKMEVFAARPDKMVMTVSLPGLGDITTGYNGEVGWMSTAITGPMLLEGKMKEDAATQADFDHAIHDPADYKVMDMFGKEEFDGEDCYKLKLVHRSGFESTEFFSVKTGLQRGFISTQTTQFGPVSGTTIVSDYKKFGDLLMPARTVQKLSGIEEVATIKEMDFDKVDPGVFELPPEVKTLLQQKKKAAEPQPNEEKKKQ